MHPILRMEALFANIPHRPRRFPPVMPASSVFCPHCESHVEIQVAAVTRSRECPKCGETLVLQVAERDSAAKRKALLVAPVSPIDKAVERHAPLENGFKDLPEDPFERMRQDPSLAGVKRQLAVGVAMVLILITAAIFLHVMEDPTQVDGAEAEAMEVALPEALPAKEVQHVSPAFASVSLEERLARLKEGMEDAAQPKQAKLPPPVFEMSTEAAADAGGTAAPPVFELSERAGVVAPPP
jgi:hypothetical protein